MPGSIRAIRLDWLNSGTVMALLLGGGVLFVLFLINEALVAQPWAHFNVLFSRNIGLSLVVILLYTLTSLCNSSLVPNFLSVVGGLRPEQTGVLLFIYGALPMFVLTPISIYLLRHFDPRTVVVLGLSAFAAANLLGTQLSHDWAREDFTGIVMLTSVGQAFTLLPIIVMALSNSDPARATSFAAYIQIMRLGGAEIGVAVMGTWLRVREQIHSNYLGSHIENGAVDVTRLLQKLTNFFASHGVGSAPARGSRNALGASGARGQYARLHRRLLAVLLDRDGRPRRHRADHPRAAGPVHPGTVRLCEKHAAQVWCADFLRQGSAHRHSTPPLRLDQLRPRAG